MANTQSAFINSYRSETVAAFEQNYSLLRDATTREAVVKGNVAVFLVAGSGGVSAVTRGINGYLPFGVVNNAQLSCTLTEYHAPFETTDFNIFASQGDQKRIMQMASIAVLNRNIDKTILTELDTGATLHAGSATVGSVDVVERALTILGNNEVPVDEEENLFAIITPAMRSYLRQTTEFANGQYVEVKPYAGPIRKMWRWAGINWITSVRITGIGTSSEKCYLLHKNAIGHAANSKEMEVDVGYERKQKNSWTNASLYHGAKTLQTAGIVQILHDGSGYVAT
jgi:hypothetical protein